MAHTNSIELRALIEAPRQRVFEAWIAPHVVTTWFPVAAGAESVSANSECTAGGSYRYAMSIEGIEEIIMQGVYKELDEPEKLVMSMTFEPVHGFDSFPQTTITASFEDYDVRTRVLLDHGGLLDEMLTSVAKEWRRAFSRLESRLREDAEES